MIWPRLFLQGTVSSQILQMTTYKSCQLCLISIQLSNHFQRRWESSSSQNYRYPKYNIIIHGLPSYPLPPTRTVPPKIQMGALPLDIPQPDCVSLLRCRRGLLDSCHFKLTKQAPKDYWNLASTIDGSNKKNLWGSWEEIRTTGTRYSNLLCQCS